MTIPDFVYYICNIVRAKRRCLPFQNEGSLLSYLKPLRFDDKVNLFVKKKVLDSSKDKTFLKQQEALDVYFSHEMDKISHSCS